MELSAFERVQNGISFLNNHFKGNSWASKIDLAILDLSIGDKCIIGQTIGVFGEVNKNILKLSDEDCEKYGFIAYGFFGFNFKNEKIYFEDCKVLEREWTKQINLILGK